MIALALMLLLAAPDGTCDVGSSSPVETISYEIAAANDAGWRKRVAEEIYTTDGVWGPSTTGMKKVAKSKLNGCLSSVHRQFENISGDAPDVFTKKIDGRSVWLFSAQGDGATMYELRDARCQVIPMGNKAHEPVPLKYPAEVSPRPSRKTWLTHLKDVNRYPTMMRDTPVVSRDSVPKKVRDKIAKLEKKYGTDEYGTFDVDVEVHKVRMDSYTSYIVYLGTYEGVGIINLDSNGTELDVDF